MFSLDWNTSLRLLGHLEGLGYGFPSQAYAA